MQQRQLSMSLKTTDETCVLYGVRWWERKVVRAGKKGRWPNLLSNYHKLTMVEIGFFWGVQIIQVLLCLGKAHRQELSQLLDGKVKFREVDRAVPRTRLLYLRACI